MLTAGGAHKLAAVVGAHGYRGMALVELAPDVTLDEIAAKTEATYRVALD